MMIVSSYTIKKLEVGPGICPFDKWFDVLSEEDQLMVDDRLARVRMGNFGDINFVGQGVWELKFYKGRALRIYYGNIGAAVILLICGGDKRTQKRDIKKAQELFQAYKRGIEQ